MYTQHAQTRCQQRSISPEIVDTILAYGDRKRHRGADVYFMNPRTRQRVAKAMGSDRYHRIEKRLDTYLVVGDDGRLITAAKRIKCLKY